MTKTEAIINFLNATEGGARELGNVNEEYAGKYTAEFEVQVNVGRYAGEIKTGVTRSGQKWRGFTDGTNVWKNFRIPWRANSDPTFTDGTLNFDLDKYADAIGCTGWNWLCKQSTWCGFDFDSIVGHREGLSDDELGRIFAAVRNVPWVSIYSSTSGAGYHLYVNIINSPQINTHTEHAAFCRAVLSRLSGLVGFELTSKVDVAGGILWVWKRGAVGYKCLKQGEDLDGNDVPEWREHGACGNKRGRRKTIFDSEPSWRVIANSTRKIQLDGDHLKLLKWLDERKAMWWWDADHWMLVTHTASLKEAHRELNLRGIFETVAEGKEDFDQNCYAFPLPMGGWVVRRRCGRVFGLKSSG